MTAPLEPRPLRRDLRFILADGMACSLMVGIGESYLPAFALAMGMSEIASGLIASVPMLIGAALQMISPAAVRRLGSYRRWVILCVLVQAASFVPLITAALYGRIPPLPLFLLASLYWASGLAAGPAWSTWVGWLVPRPLRARYFGARSRWCHAALMGGLLGGGALLQFGSDRGWRLQAFAAIFLIAGAARFASALFLKGQSEPRPVPRIPRSVPLRELLGRIRGRADGRLLLYLVGAQATAAIASPYFNPYMLEKLAFSYDRYMTLLGCAFLGRVALLPALGRFAHRFGAAALLRAAGFAIVPLPAFWLLTTAYEPLLVVQFVTGTAWGAYELASFLLYFDSVEEHERTSLLTTYQFAHAAGTVGGSALGAVWLATLHESTNAYLYLFAISTAARALTLIPLARVRAAEPALAPAALVAPGEAFDPRFAPQEPGR
ncbi:MAG: MFS transporter [Planctomycetaceae bacterium]